MSNTSDPMLRAFREVMAKASSTESTVVLEALDFQAGRPWYCVEPADAAVLRSLSTRVLSTYHHLAAEQETADATQV